MSTFDFITAAPPLPPDIDHPKLLEFREHNMTKKRHVGPAELMLEANFTDVSDSETVGTFNPLLIHLEHIVKTWW